MCPSENNWILIYYSTIYCKPNLHQLFIFTRIFSSHSLMYFHLYFALERPWLRSNLQHVLGVLRPPTVLPDKICLTYISCLSCRLLENWYLQRPFYGHHLSDISLFFFVMWCWYDGWALEVTNSHLCISCKLYVLFSLPVKLEGTIGLHSARPSVLLSVSLSVTLIFRTFYAMLSHRHIFCWMKVDSKLLYEELQIKFDFRHGWTSFSWVIALCSKLVVRTFLDNAFTYLNESW